jgi:hypothetical protein
MSAKSDRGSYSAIGSATAAIRAHTVVAAIELAR